MANEYRDFIFNYDNSKNDLKLITISVSSPLVQLYVGAKSRCDLARPDCKNVLYGNDKRPVNLTKFKTTYA